MNIMEIHIQTAASFDAGSEQAPGSCDTDPAEFFWITQPPIKSFHPGSFSWARVFFVFKPTVLFG